VSTTTIAFTVTHFLMGPDMGQYIGRLPIIFDLEANTIAVFLSFSFNENWYLRFRCNLCAQSFMYCCFRYSRDEKKMIELCVLDAAHQNRTDQLKNVNSKQSSSQTSSDPSKDCGGSGSTDNDNCNGNSVDIPMDVMVKASTDSAESEQSRPTVSPLGNMRTHPVQYSMSIAKSYAHSPSNAQQHRSPYSSKLSPGLFSMKHNKTLSESTYMLRACDSNRKRTKNTIYDDKERPSEEYESKEMSASPRMEAQRSMPSIFGMESRVLPMLTPQSELQLGTEEHGQDGVLKKKGCQRPFELIHAMADNPVERDKTDCVHLKTESGLQIVKETLETIPSSFEAEIE